MLRSASLLCWLWLAAACSAPAPAPAPEPGPAPTPPNSWKIAMRHVEADLDFIGLQLQSPGFGNLRQVANTARAAAEQMAFGYGVHEQKDIPGFAGLSREVETWFLQIGLEAAQGHGDLARDLYRQRTTRHCVYCHDIAEQHGRRFDFAEPRDGK